MMITGQKEECTQERFDAYYKPAIIFALEACGASFVMGAAEGVDAMARVLLLAHTEAQVTVFDKGDKDGSGNGPLPAHWKIVNEFASYPDRDNAMINTATNIIAYLFENAVTSGTWGNLMKFAQQKSTTIHQHGYGPGATLNPEDTLVLARVYTRDMPYASKLWMIDDCSFDTSDH